MLTDYITQQEYEGRLAEIKEEISNDSSFMQHNLSDYILYLETQLKALNKLNEATVIDENTPLKICISDRLRMILALSGICNIEKVTLKKFSELPLLKVTKVRDIKAHHLQYLKALLKKVNLKFEKI